MAASQAATTYVNQTQAQQRFRNEQLMRMNHGGQALMGQQLNMPGGYPARMVAGGMNGVVHAAQDAAGSPGDMAHKASQPLQRSVMHRLVQQRPNQMPAALGRGQMMQPMQNREGEMNDVNGQQRPQSPAAAAASPGNKRVRLENGQYEQVGNGRGGTPQANGINPTALSPQQFATFQATSNKGLAQMKGGPGGMPQNPGQGGAPMMPQTSEGGLTGGMSEFYAPPGSTMRAGTLSGGTGNHALQDYQMQLMILEQQNKKRLMMARQEQDQIATHGDANRPGGYHQGMSPNSRPAPSPGPGGKPNMAGTPKIANQVGPGSPLPDGQIGAHVQRNSPATGFNGQMTEGGHPMINYPMGNAGGPGVPNGNMMRPPGGFDGQMQPGMPGQMNPQLRAQAGRGQPTNMWPAQQQAQHAQQQQQQQQQAQQAQQQLQMQQQQQQQAQAQQAQQAQQQVQQQAQQQPQNPQPGQQPNQPPQPVGTPQPGRQNLTHAAMPPPQAPANAPNAARPAPASPQVSNQPPTPTQTAKPNPKNKVARDQNAKKPPRKKGPTPAPSAVTPTTSEPPTPTTPHHPHSFSNSAQARTFTSGGPNQPGNMAAGQPVQQPTPNAPTGSPSVPNDALQAPTFSGIGDMNVDFHPFDDNSADLLDNFDFDSFLNTNDDNNVSSLGFGSGYGLD